MFRFIKKMVIGLLYVCIIVSFSRLLVSNSYLIKSISLTYRPCEVRPKIIDIKSNETIFYPFIVNVNKYGGNCNTINYPYAQVCVPNKVKYKSKNI